MGQAGGNLCLWGPERFFSIVRNAQYNYPLFGRTRIYQRKMQNKPNFLDAQMNVNIYLQMAYKNEPPFGRGQNKPNSNPIKPNTKPISEMAKMNLNCYPTKDYEDKSNWTLGENKPNFKPNQTQFYIKFPLKVLEAKYRNINEDPTSGRPIYVLCRKTEFARTILIFRYALLPFVFYASRLSCYSPQAIF